MPLKTLRVAACMVLSSLRLEISGGAGIRVQRARKGGKGGMIALRAFPSGYDEHATAKEGEVAARGPWAGALLCSTCKCPSEVQGPFGRLASP